MVKKCYNQRVTIWSYKLDKGKEVDKRMTKAKIYFVILGVSVIGIIITRSLINLNYTVRRKEKLEKIIPIPVLGEIPLDESCCNKIIKCEVENREVEENANV